MGEKWTAKWESKISLSQVERGMNVSFKLWKIWANIPKSKFGALKL